MSIVNGSTPTGNSVPIDRRESLCNDRPQGTFEDVSIPEACITTLHGVMVDLDPHYFRGDSPWGAVQEDPLAFYGCDSARLNSKVYYYLLQPVAAGDVSIPLVPAGKKRERQ